MGQQAANTQEKMSHSAVISFLGSGFAAAAAMLLTVLVSRAVGAEGAGLFYLAIGLFTIASQVLKLGSNSGVIRTLATQRAVGQDGHATQVLYIATVPVLVISAAAGLLIYLYADTIAAVFADARQAGDLAALMRQLAFFVAFASVLAVLHTMTRMLNSVLMFTMLQNVLLPATRVILVAIAVWLGGDAFDAVFAWAASLPIWILVTVGLLLPKLRADGRRRTVPLGRRSTRRFWAFSASRGIGGALEICLEWVDVLIVAALRSPAEAGIYAVVTRIVRAGQIIDRAMRVAVSPRIAHHFALAEMGEARALHTQATRTMILVAWPFYLTLVFFGEPVLGIFGPEFRSGAPVLSVAAIGIMVLTTTGMLQSIILMGGRGSWQVWVKSLSLVLSIALNLLLIPWLGITGAAVAWGVVILVDASISGYLVYARLKVGIDLRKTLQACLVPLLVFGPGWLCLRLTGWNDALVLIGGLAALGLIYLAVLYLLRRALGLESLVSSVAKRVRR
ncbi:oligosaccharide flippase family protein [Glutamicibacter creatinolyticus]|uniref:oligosaccharide flippase family protein n=1 Tax=Glutamicibacter creatinolyticus TaxID=162496 RepID=UPI0037C1AA8E